jgi:hypothetical protein
VITSLAADIDSEERNSMTDKIEFAYGNAFIAHAYDDSEFVDALVEGMTPEFEATRFPSIDVGPHKVVSTPIIDAIRNAAA